MIGYAFAVEGMIEEKREGYEYQFRVSCVCICASYETISW
jgi:hypothetical protein